MPNLAPYPQVPTPLMAHLPFMQESMMQHTLTPFLNINVWEALSWFQQQAQPLLDLLPNFLTNRYFEELEAHEDPNLFKSLISALGSGIDYLDHTHLIDRRWVLIIQRVTEKKEKPSSPVFTEEPEDGKSSTNQKKSPTKKTQPGFHANEVKSPPPSIERNMPQEECLSGGSANGREKLETESFNNQRANEIIAAISGISVSEPKELMLAICNNQKVISLKGDGDALELIKGALLKKIRSAHPDEKKKNKTIYNSLIRFLKMLEKTSSKIPNQDHNEWGERDEWGVLLAELILHDCSNGVYEFFLNFKNTTHLEYFVETFSNSISANLGAFIARQGDKKLFSFLSDNCTKFITNSFYLKTTLAGHLLNAKMMDEFNRVIKAYKEIKGLDKYYQYLIKSGSNVVKELLHSSDLEYVSSEKNYLGYTLAHYAALYCKKDVLSYLLDKKPDFMHKKTVKGYSLAHVAALNGNVYILDLLLKRKPLYMMNLYHESLAAEQLLKPLVYYFVRGGLDTFNWFEKKFPQFLTQRENGCSRILLYAARFGQLDVLEKIWNGKYPNEDKTGKTVAHCAAESGSSEVLDFILKKKPDLILKRDNQKMSIVHYAVLGQNPRIALEWIKNNHFDLLLELSKDKKTIIDFALSKRRLDAVEAIIDCIPGAEILRDVMNPQNIQMLAQFNPENLAAAIFKRLENDSRYLGLISPHKLFRNHRETLKAFNKLKVEVRDKTAIFLGLLDEVMKDEVIVNQLFDNFKNHAEKQKNLIHLLDPDLKAKAEELFSLLLKCSEAEKECKEILKFIFPSDKKDKTFDELFTEIEKDPSVLDSYQKRLCDQSAFITNVFSRLLFSSLDRLSTSNGKKNGYIICENSFRLFFDFYFLANPSPEVIKGLLNNMFFLFSVFTKNNLHNLLFEFLSLIKEKFVKINLTDELQLKLQEIDKTLLMEMVSLAAQNNNIQLFKFILENMNFALNDQKLALYFFSQLTKSEIPISVLDTIRESHKEIILNFRVNDLNLVQYILSLKKDKPEKIVELLNWVKEHFFSLLNIKNGEKNSFKECAIKIKDDPKQSFTCVEQWFIDNL